MPNPTNVMEIIENAMSISLAATLPALYKNLGVCIDIHRNSQNDYTLIYGVDSGSETSINPAAPTVTVGTIPTTTLVASSTGNSLVVGANVRFTSTVALPSPLASTNDYYVTAAAPGTSGTYTFSVASTVSGTAISVTTAGSGVHTVATVLRALITNMAMNPIDMFTVGSIDDAYMYTNSTLIKVGDVISFIRIGDSKTRRYKVNSLESIGYTRQIFNRYKMASLAD